MKNTATVKIFLTQGSPTSVRTAELSNWTGKAVAGPRSQIEEILKRQEANSPGVYFLTGVNPETGNNKVYIGLLENNCFFRKQGRKPNESTHKIFGRKTN